MNSNLTSCVFNIGPSRFYLHQTAQAIDSKFFKIITISGLVPNTKNLGSRIVQKFIKSENRLSGRLNGLTDEITRYESFLGEFFWQFGTLLGRYQIFNRLSSLSYSVSLSCFDLLAIRILKRYRKIESGIYYVRSGCGNKSIAYARIVGFKVVVDHSTTHPYYDYVNAKSLEKDDFPFFSLERKMINDINNSENIIVNSNFVVETFRLAGDQRKLKVLLPPIDRRFSQLLQQNNFAIRNGLIYFGLASLRKGIQEFAKVVTLLPNSLPVNIVGNWKPEMYAIRNSLSKKPNVKIESQMDFEDLVKRLSSARYFVFMAKGEGSARTVGEALHAGLIVLTTQHAGMSFKEGALFDITGMSAPEIVKIIVELEKDPNLCETISGNARTYIANLENNYASNLVEYLKAL